MARQIGYSEDEIEALTQVAESNLFDPAFKTALLYAEAMTRDAHRVDDRLFSEMKKHYGDSAIMEITAVVGLTNYWNRFTTALRIDLSGTNEPYDSPDPASRA